MNRASGDAAIYYVDVDPLKSQLQMWHVPARRFAAANSKAAVAQLAACVRRLAGEDAIVLTEVVTNSRAVAEHLRPSGPGSVVHHGGGSLGWTGGAAVGAKLAYPERMVVSLVGDGSFLLGVPSSALWVQRRYDTPSLTIIYDNCGWAGPKFSALHVHPSGAAARFDDFHAMPIRPPDLPRSPVRRLTAGRLRLNATMTRGVALCRVAVSRYRLLLLVLALALMTALVAGCGAAQTQAPKPTSSSVGY